jgi:hypothetical protein
MTVKIGHNKYENSNFLTYKKLKKELLVLMYYHIGTDPGFRKYFWQPF